MSFKTKDCTYYNTRHSISAISIEKIIPKVYNIMYNIIMTAKGATDMKTVIVYYSLGGRKNRR